MDFAREIDESVMELKDSEGHGESNSGAAGLGGIEEREDFLTCFLRNTLTLVGNFEIQITTVSLRFDFEFPPEGMAWQPFRTRFRSACFMRSRSTLIVGRVPWRSKTSRTLFFLALRLGQQKDFADQAFHVGGERVELDRAGEIEEGFHHSIEPADLVGEYLQMRANPFTLVGQFGFQDFELENHGVERILHLVRNSGSEPAEGRQLRCDINLILDLSARAGVAQGDQASHGLALFTDEVHIHRQARRGFAAQVEGSPGR